MENQILYLALAAEFGMVIQVSDYTLCLQRLYSARRKLADPLLDNLQFRRSPENPQGEIWITKTGLIQPKKPGDLTLSDILNFKS